MNGLALDQAAVQALCAFGLLCARFAPLAWIVPWAGVRRGPWSLAPALTVVLALCAWPAVAAQPPALPLSPLLLAALALRELLIGAVYALALALPLRAFEWSGALSGRFAGEGGLPDVYARLQLLLGLAAFFSLGGHRVALAALAESVVRRPVGALGGGVDAAAIAFGSVRLVADAYALALLLALPVAAAVALAQIALVLSARTVLRLGGGGRERADPCRHRPDRDMDERAAGAVGAASRDRARPGRRGEIAAGAMNEPDVRPTVLIAADAIAVKVRELGAQIARDYRGKELVRGGRAQGQLRVRRRPDPRHRPAARGRLPRRAQLRRRDRDQRRRADHAAT